MGGAVFHLSSIFRRSSAIEFKAGGEKIAHANIVPCPMSQYNTTYMFPRRFTDVPTPLVKPADTPRGACLQNGRRLAR